MLQVGIIDVSEAQEHVSAGRVYGPINADATVAPSSISMML